MANGLFQAVHDCRYLQAKFLLESGIDINCKNKHGESLLIAAMLKIGDPHKRSRMMKWLMTIGVDVSERDSKYNRDAITWAAYLNSTEDVKVILRSKEEDVRLSNVDIFGRSALHYATLHNNVEVVGMLCKRFQRYRVSVDIRDVNQITPYIVAVKLKYVECARILLEVGGASSSQVTEGFFKSSNLWNGLEEFKGSRNNSYHHHQSHLKQPEFKQSRLPKATKVSDSKGHGLPLILSNNDKISLSASRVHSKRQHTAKTSKSKSTKVSFRSMEDFSSGDYGPDDKVRRRDRQLPSIYQSIQNLKHPEFMVKPEVSKSYQKTVVPAVFNMLSQQVSDSYVPPVKPPKPDTPPAQKDPAREKKGISFGVLGNVSKFAAILKRKSQRNSEVD